MLSPHSLDVFRLRFRNPAPDVRAAWPKGTDLVDTDVGRLRFQDTGRPTGGGPTVVLTPDGPNVLEHLQPLVERLSQHARVVAFDLPGFGFSYPPLGYRFHVEDGGRATLSVLDALNLDRVTLAFSCANGFYAAAAANLQPERVAALVLAQTPSYAAMRAWAYRVVPRPVRTPIIGQLIVAATEAQTAKRWYRKALPRHTDSAPYENTAAAAFADGGCFCFAGIVQGLLADDGEVAHAPPVPVTVAWGMVDKSHRPTSPDAAREFFPNAQVEVFKDCGHFPDLEAPKRFASLVLERAPSV